MPDDAGPGPSPPWERWVLLACRLATIGLVAWIAARIPLPVLENWLAVKYVVIAGCAVTTAGKCLFDTLYYDRYWP